ncbi:MAG: 2-oxoglutarate dehydrogenase complex dihydrolipoyllysine-residue succinyltransferase [Lentisphaeria bacterium]|jgi:2-oxoglutarate dehydrogenase E2 component (dihydrolipoamide succinyltransferase)|nr:2-oxoglutarate dehydrogenase complex dihydrolipoyllysine-residue succinyltransferase [Lentisphaeria bacterium]MDP7742278.1 2-oxoglutarate dehydrogenase complex dihydrolipoyllysine-residue succinyltransferase [Lentisphaeria bacterium]
MSKLEITVPAAGESVGEGDIARWFKEDGDMVELDEPLLELETDKASMEIASPGSGRLSITVPAGTTVLVGKVVGHVDTAQLEQAEAPPQADETDPSVTGQMETAEIESSEEDTTRASTTKNVEMPSPAARKLMVENHVSAQDVPGTGKGGRITKADVLRYIKECDDMEATADIDRFEGKAPPPPADTEPVAPEGTPETAPMTGAPAPAPPGGPEAPAPPGSRPTRREHMSRLRRTIAERMVSANQSMALLTTFNEVDMSRVMEMRTNYKEAFKKKYGVNLGFMSFFIKSATQALLDFPAVNAYVEEDDIVYHDYCDICIAVATAKGLVAPVVRDTQTLSFADVEKTVYDLASRGRNGELTIDDLTGGTFTITNGGVFGSMLSTPIVNPPQSAILGMHNIVQRPTVVDGEVVIRPIMYVALSYDHRIIDGAEAVQFLVTVKQFIENPSRLLIQI